METREQVTQTGEIPVPPKEHKSTRKRSIIIFVLVSLLNIGLLALLWTQLLSPAQQNNAQTTGSDPLIGAAAPGFALTSLNGTTSGQKISLADFKGKPVVLNFWSSTCQPCNDEAPLIETQWERYQAQGVVFLGIDVEDLRNDGLQFLKQHGITYSSVIDSSSETLVKYGVTYIPETFFIDRTGKIVSAIRMEITSAQLQAGLTAIK